MHVERNVDQRRILPAPLRDWIGGPAAMWLLVELQHPTGHRYGDAVRHEFDHDGQDLSGPRRSPMTETRTRGARSPPPAPAVSGSVATRSHRQHRPYARPAAAIEFCKHDPSLHTGSGDSEVVRNLRKRRLKSHRDRHCVGPQLFWKRFGQDPQPSHVRLSSPQPGVTPTESRCAEPRVLGAHTEPFPNSLLTPHAQSMHGATNLDRRRPIRSGSHELGTFRITTTGCYLGCLLARATASRSRSSPNPGLSGISMSPSSSSIGGSISKSSM